MVSYLHVGLVASTALSLAPWAYGTLAAVDASPLVTAACTLPLSLLVTRYLYQDVYLDGISSTMINHDDGPTQTIHGVWTFQGTLSPERVTNLWHDVFSSQFPRFSQRIVKRNWLWSYWEYVDKSTWDVKDHFVYHTHVTSHEDLETDLSTLFSTPLDPTRPLWQVHVYTKYRRHSTSGGNRSNRSSSSSGDGDGNPMSALIIRMHHSLGDGVGLARALLTGMERVGPKSEHGVLKASRRAPQRRTLVSLASQAMRATLLPFQIMGCVAKLLLLPPDVYSGLKSRVPMGPLSRRSAAVRRSSFTVAHLKAYGKEHDCTINDLLVTAAAGALRRHLLETGQECPDVVRAVIWVSLVAPSTITLPPSPSRPLVFSNRALASVYVSLPIGEDTPEASSRLMAVKKTIRSLASSPEPLVANFFLRLFGWLPATLLRPIYDLSAFKVTVSMSNVPGPQFPLSFAGCDLKDLAFFVPPLNKLSTFVTLMSYDNRITFGIASDQSLISQTQAQAIVHRYFDDELRRLTSGS